MDNTNTLTQSEERSSLQVPKPLWVRARKAALELGVTATQLVIEGLEWRLSRADVKKKVRDAA